MFNDILGSVSLYDMLCYFFLYGFLGWVTEVVYATLKTGKFVNRGFLNGPICPIYGVGMALAVLLLNTVADKWWLLFLAGMALATALEFLTGFVLDKIFKTKWWDYTKEPLNIKGYVCLRFSILWGIGIVLVFNTLVPLSDKLIDVIPAKWWGLAIILALAAVLIADVITDIAQLKHLNDKFKEMDNVAILLRKESDAIGGKISGATVVLSDKLKKLKASVLKSRIVKAFPLIGEKGGRAAAGSAVTEDNGGKKEEND